MSERTPQDFAIEHAEYMAQSAEHLIAAVNDLALAEEQHDEGTANPSDVDAARETITEMLRDTRNSIYEFRKRRDRAAVEAAQPEAVGWELVPIEPTPAMLVAMWDHRESMRGQSENRIARAGYAAMLASAPTPEPMSAPTAPAQAEPVHWRALLDPAQRPQKLQTRHHVVGFTSYKACEEFVASELDMNGWRYTIEPLYNRPALATPPTTSAGPSDAERQSFPPPAKVNRYCRAGMCLTTDAQHEDDCAAIRATKGGKL